MSPQDHAFYLELAKIASPIFVALVTSFLAFGLQMFNRSTERERARWNRKLDLVEGVAERFYSNLSEGREASIAALLDFENFKSDTARMSRIETIVAQVRADSAKMEMIGGYEAALRMDIFADALQTVTGHGPGALEGAEKRDKTLDRYAEVVSAAEVELKHFYQELIGHKDPRS